MLNRNYYTITLSLLGAAKLILNSFGINLITDQMANDLANAIATILTVFGVIMTHLKNHPKISFKSFVANIFSKFKKKTNTAITAKITTPATQVETVTKTVQTTSSPVEKTVTTEQPKEEDPATPAAPVQPTISDAPTTTDTTNKTVQK